MKVIQHPGPLTRLRNANIAALEERLAELRARLDAEPVGKLAWWVIINTSTCEALDITPTPREATQVPLWHATRYPTRPGELARVVDGKAVRVRDMYAYWRHKLTTQLEALRGPDATLPDGDAIRGARVAAGLTQEQAAQLVHLGDRKRWNEYEQGKRPIDPARWELFQLKTKEPQ